MDELLELIKTALGDAWSEDLATSLGEALTPAVDARIARETDKLRAEALEAKKQAKSAAAGLAKVSKELEAAGKTENEALLEARRLAEEGAAEAQRLRSEIKARDVRDAAFKALSDVPEERRAVALKALSLDGVDVDEAGTVVGLQAQVEALKTSNAWLWEPAKRTPGNGGPPAGADPAAKPPQPKAEQPGDLGARLARRHINRRRAQRGLPALEG